jgi:hypothetical protein
MRWAASPPDHVVAGSAARTGGRVLRLIVADPNAGMD